MSTRAVITFIGDRGHFSVYQHMDGDPDTVIADIKETLFGPDRLCWQPPRWEANEFAAAYIASHKSGPGGIRLSRGPTTHSDLDWRYTVDAMKNNIGLLVSVKNGKTGKYITSHRIDF